MHFYQRLKDMREDHEYEQKDIAKVLETTQQQYSNFAIGLIPASRIYTCTQLFDDLS